MAENELSQHLSGETTYKLTKGDTSNLAARLQGLTRDLNAAVVIDSATRTGAEDAAADFERREGMPIRGRRQNEDVYSLALLAKTPPTPAYPPG